MSAATRKDALAGARSLLFVPGNRPERFAKALASGADAVILDLEDAVPEAEKAEARRAILAQWPALRASPTPLLLRLNAPGTPEWREDLGLPGQLPGLAGLICPKAESAAPLAALAPEGLPLIPLIESAHGWAALAEIAGAPGVLRVALGHIDFMADTGLDDSAEEEALAPLRFAIAMHSRLAGLASAIDGVTVQTGDEARLAEDAKRALRFGFGAKLCIHPRQIEPLHQALRPAPSELDWAQRVLAGNAAAKGAAFQLDGRMVDLPVVLRAQRLLARAR